MNLISAPSPNWRGRKSGVRVDTVLLHHTGSGHRDNSVSWLRNPDAGVSAHYVVDRNGDVYALVDEKHAAKHAGWGRMPWEPARAYDFNDRSVGIELANAGDGKEPFTEAQYLALAELVPDIARRLGTRARVRDDKEWGFWMSGHDVSRPAYVLGHRDVACDKHTAAFGRKTDPADNFDWARVRAALADSGRVA